MKTVGVRVLKDNLSRYLKFVQKGETVLIKDRDEVVAELRRAEPADSTEEVLAFIEREYRAGKLTKPTFKNNMWLQTKHESSQKKIVTIDTQAILNQIRSER